ncbi:hypothetical protein [Paenibacillus senegalimassiliensis]|uniref:hypothetical protein n=1 Tax=Paenibacillus senegalimassiliensis TaxID=1737426 RepID=UPI00073F69A0|nr:hypothetical protein [Paenibacillus senegalimassiliensis]
MKIAYAIGIVLMSAGIGYGEWRASKEKRAQIAAVGMISLAAILAMALIFFPDLPGPTQLVLLLFGWLDKYL